MYRDRGQEVVVALRAGDGRPVWEQRYDAPLPEGLYTEHGAGPHATPAIDGRRLFTLGIAGRLQALDRRTGALLWSHDLTREYGAKPPDCGYAASPLVHRGLLLVPVGAPGHGVMAFRTRDGEVAWSAHDFGASYATPLIIDVGAQEQLVVLAAAEVAGLEPSSGRLLWSHPHATRYGANASTPVWGDDGILFITAAYDNGSRGLRVRGNGSASAVEELWHQRRMQVHFGNVIRVGDHVYGSSGDFGPALLSALDVRSGELSWQKRDVVGKASLLDLGQGVLLLLDEKGKLVLARVSPHDVTVLAEHQLLEGRTWTVPTLVGRRLYVRDAVRLRAFALDRP
jgi:outer membrane protein assembly factor BamB